VGDLYELTHPRHMCVGPVRTAQVAVHVEKQKVHAASSAQVDEALLARIVSLGLAYRPEWRLFES
jgi:hypothetical protein